MVEEMVIEMEIEKETSNTYRYKEVPKRGQPPVVKTIYIQKWIFGEEPPRRIRVTISF